MAVAGSGVAMKVTMITGMLAMGVVQGVQPLLGYYVGAGIWERYRKILKFLLCFSFILSAIMTVICYLFTNQIVSVFLTETSTFEYGIRFAGILLTTSVFFGVFYVLTNALQAMGAANPSFIINLSRQGIIYIPALYILNSFLGANGLILAQPVADVLSIGLAVILYIITAKKMMKGYDNAV